MQDIHQHVVGEASRHRRRAGACRFRLESDTSPALEGMGGVYCEDADIA